MQPTGLGLGDHRINDFARRAMARDRRGNGHPAASEAQSCAVERSAGNNKALSDRGCSR